MSKSDIDANGPAHDYTKEIEESRKRTIGRIFKELARIWHEETGHLSSITTMCKHPAYRCIVSLGKDVLPFIMQEELSSLFFWGEALEEITGKRPFIPEEQRGRVQYISQAWLELGIREGWVP